MAILFMRLVRSSAKGAQPMELRDFVNYLSARILIVLVTSGSEEDGVHAR